MVMLDVALLGVRAALGQSPIHDTIKNFVMLILVAGLFLAVINHYGEWINNIIKGLKTIGLELSGGFNTDAPFIAGLKIVEKILNAISNLSGLEGIITGLQLLIVALIVLICFALIAARVIVIKCESYICIYSALILLGFGGSSFTRDFGINSLKYVLSVAFKLFVLQLLIGTGISFIDQFVNIGSGTELQVLLPIIGASIVLWALANSLPEACAGIITGAHVGGGGGLGAGASSLGGMAGGAAGAAVGAAAAPYAAGKTVSDANKLANLEGRTGVGKAGNMAKNIASAYRQARNQPGETTRSKMAEMLGLAVADHQDKNGK